MNRSAAGEGGPTPSSAAAGSDLRAETPPVAAGNRLRAPAPHPAPRTQGARAPCSQTARGPRPRGGRVYDPHAEDQDLRVAAFPQVTGQQALPQAASRRGPGHQPGWRSWASSQPGTRGRFWVPGPGAPCAEGAQERKPLSEAGRRCANVGRDDGKGREVPGSGRPAP